MKRGESWEFGGGPELRRPASGRVVGRRPLALTGACGPDAPREEDGGGDTRPWP
jgi:hypothetical protein